MSSERIVELERNIGELIAELNDLRKTNPGTPVPNYTFATLTGQVTLRELFGGKDKLLAIHNMGQGLPLLHVVGGRLKRLACPSRIGSVHRPALEGSAGSSAPVWQRARLAVSLRVARRRGIHS